MVLLYLIQLVVNATNLIADGDYSNKVNVKSKIEEINNMINSVNKLANNLEEQENLRKILTRDISHELRTPLTTISVQVEALIDGIWEPTEERLKSIYDEIERLTRLVGSLEKLSTYEEDNFLINKESVDIKDLINTLIINFEKQLLDKKIELILNLNSITIYCDKDKISQAIINILSNSIKYSNEGGKIYINTFDDKEYNYISIKDTGIGIDKNNIKYIFERFYRVDKSRDRKSGGIGVGLTIAKTIVEKHSGTIIVKSKVNCGSEFIIKLSK